MQFYCPHALANVVTGKVNAWLLCAAILLAAFNTPARDLVAADKKTAPDGIQ